MTILTDIQPFPGVEKNSTYLVLISPESIPHLCLIHRGLYYSLTFKECEIGKDFTTYMQFLVRARRKILFVEVDQVVENPWTVFKRYEKLAGTNLTCIVPVKETIFPESKAEYIFQLIPELIATGKMKQVFHLNMEMDFKDKCEFKLREYSKETIYAYIQALNSKHEKLLVKRQ